MVQIYSAIKGFFHLGFIFILDNKVKYFKPKQDQTLNVTRAFVEVRRLMSVGSWV